MRVIAAVPTAAFAVDSMAGDDPKRKLAASPVSRVKDSPEAPESAYIAGQEIASPSKGQIYIRV